MDGNEDNNIPNYFGTVGEAVNCGRAVVTAAAPGRCPATPARAPAVPSAFQGPTRTATAARAASRARSGGAAGVHGAILRGWAVHPENARTCQALAGRERAADHTGHVCMNPRPGRPARLDRSAGPRASGFRPRRG